MGGGGRGSIVLAIAFAFFAFGWIGGGDAKLVSATTLWFGFGFMLQYLIYAALLGGALTLLILWFRRYPLPDWLARHKWIDRLHNPKSGRSLWHRSRDCGDSWSTRTRPSSSSLIGG